MVISGGNDGKIVLQTWDKKLEHSSSYRCRPQKETAPAADLTLVHRRKINCIATGERTPTHIFVADVSKGISIYHIQ